MWGGVIIFLLATVIISVIVGVLDQALSSIYIFYCLDEELRGQGVQVDNIPKEIRELLREGAGYEEAVQASN